MKEQELRDVAKNTDILFAAESLKSDLCQLRKDRGTESTRYGRIRHCLGERSSLLSVALAQSVRKSEAVAQRVTRC